MKHVNAVDVLPAKLVQKLQRYCVGYVWIPSVRQQFIRRRREIRQLRKKGMSTADIARQLRMSQRRVRQILAEEGKRKSGESFP